MSDIIEPKVLKGFRDSLPETEIGKSRIIRTLERCFSSYGFVPIDTPVLEYTDVLLGKGGGETDKQIFRFRDNGKRDVAMRFDLTVPFARFMAANLNTLALPFKRYHISKVWRGENPQKGRYREFTQCDFDIVGVDNSEADFEILSIMNDSFARLGVKDYHFHLAHRGLFNAFLCHLGIEEHSTEILREVDKIRKIGQAKVEENLNAIIPAEKTALVLQFITKADSSESFLDTVKRLSALAGGEKTHTARILEIHSFLENAGIADRFIYDPSITRGLDYYTGIVYETFLDGLEQFGSVCSGGRYNNLASLYTKQQLPGVGSSIGLDRLMAALPSVAGDSSSSDVVILSGSPEEKLYHQSVAQKMREAGLRVDNYLTDKKIGQQYKYAETNRIPFAIIAKSEEREEGKVTLKNLKTREQKKMIDISEAVAVIREALS